MKEVVEIDGWVATDPSGDTYLYDKKPFKDEKWWTGPGTSIRIDISQELKDITKKNPVEAKIVISINV